MFIFIVTNVLPEFLLKVCIFTMHHIPYIFLFTLFYIEMIGLCINVEWLIGIGGLIISREDGIYIS